MQCLESQLTILLQGKIEIEHRIPILKMVEAFPDASFILSCWVQDEIPEELLTINKITVVRNYDLPPPTKVGSKLNNINRQLFSTREGLKHVKTEFVCKLRTDTFFKNSKVINIYNKLISSSSPPKTFTQRVLGLTLTSINPCSGPEKLLFHPCDWLFFGLTNDVASLFDIPLLPDEDFFVVDHSTYPARIRAEQYYYVEHLKKSEISTIRNCGEYSAELYRLSDGLLLTDFILVNPAYISLVSSKHKGIWKWRQGTYQFYHCYLRGGVRLSKQCFTFLFFDLMLALYLSQFLVRKKLKLIKDV